MLSNDSISDSDFDTMDPRSLAATVARVGARSEAVRNRLEQGSTAFNRGPAHKAPLGAPDTALRTLPVRRDQAA